MDISISIFILILVVIIPTLAVADTVGGDKVCVVSGTEAERSVVASALVTN